MILIAVGLFVLGGLLVLPYILRRQKAKSQLPRWLMFGGVVLILASFIVAVARPTVSPARPTVDSAVFEQTATQLVREATQTIEATLTETAPNGDPFMQTATALVEGSTAETPTGTPPATFADPYVLTTTAIIETVTAEANE